jgi:glucosamine--fructose-6-phosphate aminotransferase (isomerizing)
MNRLTVALATPSLFGIYQHPPRLANALVIGISQSGQSPDIVEVIAEAQSQGAPTIAVTNDPESPLATAASHLIQLRAGEEKSIAATKTYTAQLVSLALLATQMSGSVHDLNSIPEAMSRALDSESQAQEAAKKLAHSDRCVVIGRGYNYATAFEIALKIKELTYVAAEPYSSADFKHGPIAMVEKDFPVVMVDVGEVMRKEMRELKEKLEAKGATVVTIGDAADSSLPVPSSLPEHFTPIISILPGQLLAYHLAFARGLDPNNPRTISKVTLTR